VSRHNHGSKKEDIMQSRSKGNLQNLIPIAVVVTGGCESCAEKRVKQALTEGSTWEQVKETLDILADMQKRECVLKALGPEVVARMEKPLAAGRRALQEAKPVELAASACGCG
jgi:AhpD family alkylhydroperoxidase